MIEVRPYDDLAAYAVLSRLDVSDQLEAELIRGAHAASLELFADWRAVIPASIGGHVFFTEPSAGGVPFAVGALVASGQAGVAQAALLARDHRHFRRPLVQLARRLRAELPSYCVKHNINRIEARCWADHPTAARFLGLIGFSPEAILYGFGPSGQVPFIQFAMVNPVCSEPPVASLENEMRS